MTVLGIKVARTSSRKMKITITTRITVMISVFSTSSTAALMVCVLSRRMWTLIPGGMFCSSCGSCLRIWLTVVMTLAPGCLKITSRMPWSALNAGSSFALPGKTQAPIWLFSTPGIAWPTSEILIGAPLL